MQIRNVKLLNYFGINAIVLYPLVLYASRSPDQRIINHEGIHLQQIRRDGVLRFYYHYLKEYFLHRKSGKSHHEAYLQISYEVEAYEHQHDRNYAVTSKSSGKLPG